jgi:uncharacterized membrane protein
MLVDAWEGRHRSLAKAISWRIAGSIDTLVLSYLVTRSLVFASSIAGIETFTKIALYYLHERAWIVIPWGKRSRKARRLLRIFRRLATAVAAAWTRRALPRLAPSRVAAVAALLFCLAIVLMPPRDRWGSSELTESASIAANHEAATRRVSAETADAVASHRADDAAGMPWERASPAPEPARWVFSEPAQTAEAHPQSTPDIGTEVRAPTLLDPERVKEIQQELIRLGYLSANATGLWGPLSRRALKAFKSDHDLPSDEMWDEATERTLFSDDPASLEPFIGVWGVDGSACSARLNRNGSLPAVIDSEGAWAGETFCAFRAKKRTRNGWDLVASCANARDRWTANVRLAVAGAQLVWTSERGAQTYMRCQPKTGVAGAF